MSELMKYLREQERIQLEITRRKNRIEAINSSRRGLGYASPLKLSDDTVESVASKLKVKGTISTDDLLKLMYALSEHEDHIATFFKTPGAFYGLVKEFTGNDAQKQLIAAGCICNLALGPTKSCLTIVKLSGTYLNTYLRSENKHLIELCTWTLGNLCASDKRIVELLEAQGIVDNLIFLLDDNFENRVVDSTAYALGHMVYSNFEAIKYHHLEEITKKIIFYKRGSDQILWLIYLLSDKESLQKLFAYYDYFMYSVMRLVTAVKVLSSTNLCYVNCLIRIAANLCNPQISSCSDCSHVVFTPEFEYSMKKILVSDHIDMIKDTLWLLGNIHNVFINRSESILLFTRISKEFNNIISLIN